MYNIIPGQVKEKATLSHMVTSNRLPHALLILGNAGYGGLSMAITLANHMTCLNPLPDSPCGECKACIKSAKLIHPDIHFSFPVLEGASAFEKYPLQMESDFQSLRLHSPTHSSFLETGR